MMLKKNSMLAVVGAAFCLAGPMVHAGAITSPSSVPAVTFGRTSPPTSDPSWSTSERLQYSTPQVRQWLDGNYRYSRFLSSAHAQMIKDFIALIEREDIAPNGSKELKSLLERIEQKQDFPSYQEMSAALDEIEKGVKLWVNVRTLALANATVVVGDGSPAPSVVEASVNTLVTGGASSNLAIGNLNGSGRVTSPAGGGNVSAGTINVLASRSGGVPPPNSFNLAIFGNTFSNVGNDAPVGNVGNVGNDAPVGNVNNLLSDALGGGGASQKNSDSGQKKSGEPGVGENKLVSLKKVGPNNVVLLSFGTIDGDAASFDDLSLLSGDKNDAADVAEPATLALIASALLILAGLRRRETARADG